MPALTRPRTTVPLTGTTLRTSAQFDHTASVALAWAGRWLQAAGAGLSVPASGVIRRALSVYAGHLDRLPEDQRAAEFHATLPHCQAREPGQDTQRAAFERLEATPRTALPEPFGEVLHGLGWAQRLQEFDERCIALASRCLKRRAKPVACSPTATA